MTEKETRPAANGTDHQLLDYQYPSGSDALCRCTKCGTPKRLADMAPDRQRKSGRRTWCRDCKSTYDRQRYLTNRDPILSRQRRYRQANPGTGWAACYRKRAQRYGVTPIVEMLTAENLIARWGNRCFYCLTGPFEHLDHITPVAAGGHHILSNVVPCCRDCNVRKRWASDESAIKRYRSSLAPGGGG